MGGPSGSHSHIVVYPVLALEPPLACLISSVWVYKKLCSIIPFCNSGVFFYFCCLSVDIPTDFPALVVIPSNVRRNQQRNKEKLTEKVAIMEKDTARMLFALLVALKP